MLMTKGTLPHDPNRRWGKEAVRQTPIYISTSIQRGLQNTSSKKLCGPCYFSILLPVLTPLIFRVALFQDLIAALVLIWPHGGVHRTKSLIGVNESDVRGRYRRAAELLSAVWCVMH
jgi:hypothetical protein